jgi:hypothetical protein
MRAVEIIVATRDSEQNENEGWVCVRITVHNVLEFGLRERPSSTLQVMSQGVHLRVFDDGVGVEFGGAIEAPQSHHELQSSDAFVFGEAVGFETMSYF